MCVFFFWSFGMFAHIVYCEQQFIFRTILQEVKCPLVWAHQTLMWFRFRQQKPFHSHVQIWSLLAPKTNNGDGNPKASKSISMDDITVGYQLKYRQTEI